MNTVMLHPSMTLQQIAVWCAHHGREARISWTIQDDELRPVVTAVRAAPADMDWWVALPTHEQDTGLGMAWWNSLSEQERARALLAANSCVPADAWAHHCRQIDQMNSTAQRSGQ